MMALSTSRGGRVIRDIHSSVIVDVDDDDDDDDEQRCMDDGCPRHEPSLIVCLFTFSQSWGLQIARMTEANPIRVTDC